MTAFETTKLYMKHYKDIWQFVNDMKEHGESIIHEKGMETLIMLEHINRAIECLKNETTAAGEKYKYDAFKMHYIDGESYQNIRMVLNCGKNTPKKWCDELVRRLSIKLYGIKGIENGIV